MKKVLLEKLLSVIDEMVTSTEITFSRSSLSKKLYKLDKSKEIQNRYFNRSLKRLVGSSSLKSFNMKDDVYYSLSKKGINILLDYRLRHGKFSHDQRWDGFWRLIIFDIPEDKKSIREAFRRKLRHYNFYPLQKSVFVFPFECEKEIQELADSFEIGEHTEIILAKSLGRNDDRVREFFKFASIK